MKSYPKKTKRKKLYNFKVSIDVSITSSYCIAHISYTSCEFEGGNTCNLHKENIFLNIQDLNFVFLGMAKKTRC